MYISPKQRIINLFSDINSTIKFHPRYTYQWDIEVSSTYSSNSILLMSEWPESVMPFINPMIENQILIN